jgi:hypothetical protein
MNAPIGRLRIRTSEPRKRRPSATGRWRPADAPLEAEVTEADQSAEQGEPPRFYPFPLHSSDEDGD